MNLIVVDDTNIAVLIARPSCMHEGRFYVRQGVGTHPAASCDPPETGGWTGG